MDTTIPPEVPGVELGALLGRGGTSEVWEGVLSSQGRRVAVKVAGGDAESAEAALREAAVSSRVAAEHLLTVESCVALADGRVALVMPLLRGGSLAALVRARGHLSPGEVVTVLAPLAAALGRLHAAGVVHGDVSPGNVLLDLEGRPVLADLGLGRVLGEAPAAVWGTPGHVAPEVLLGADPSPAADVYALGALGWLCLAGEVAGAPGLRSPLSEVCRAGAGSQALVEAVEAAVDPRAEARPTADELGWLLFGAAEPEPLHLVTGADDVSAVTYRLRAAAGRAPRAVAPARGRHRRPGLPRTPGPPRGLRTRPGLTAVGLVVLLVLLGVMASTALRGEEPARATPGARAAVHPAAAPPTRSTPPTRRPPPAGEPSPSRPPGPADPRLDPAGPSARPAELLTVLADARARAYREADPRHLRGADAVGGALEARDVAAVGRLRAAGLRYEGLEYDVAEVKTVSAEARVAVVRARVGSSGYRVTGAAAASPAAGGEQVLVDLVRTPDGWRVREIRPG